MICLKIRTFVVSATTYCGFNTTCSCCDLLENSYLCGISNNESAYLWIFFTVVICLKIRTFVVSATTKIFNTRMVIKLWFAWKFVPLWYQQQQAPCLQIYVHRCDLLENSYLCGISNNRLVFFPYSQQVVICLKIRTFVVSATTPLAQQVVYRELWFAWKFVPLWYQQQPTLPSEDGISSCDLLENSYLCGISNNKLSSITSSTGLWFAWKFVPLWYQQQLLLQFNRHS